MNQANIEAAIFRYVDSLDNIPPVYFPNEKNEALPKTPQDNHLRVFVLPSASVSIGLVGVDQQRGILQFSIFTKEGVGTAPAARIADALAGHFPRGTVLQSNQTKVRFDQAAKLAPPVPQDGWHTLVFSINYTVTE